MSLTRFLTLAACAGLTLGASACDGSKPLIKRDEKAPRFPAADRQVAHIVSSRWSNEEARDRLNEASEVMNKAGIAQGMTVA
ncbi:MAG: SAM-dependent methyltransferase, partial [Sphingomonas sp.]